MKIKFIVLLTLFISSFILFAQDADSVKEEENQDPIIEEEADSEEDPVISLKESRIDTLRFGIESEVIDVLQSIFSEKAQGYNDVLTDLIESEKNPKILQLVYQIFTDAQYDGAIDSAMEQLQRYVDDERVDDKSLMAAMTYLGDINAQQAQDLFYDSLQEENESITSYALTQIGKLGPYSRSEELLDLFNEYEDESNDVASNVILAWGELKYSNAVDILIELVEDEYAEKTHRQYAAEALGKIGDPEGLEPVNQLYLSSNDSMTRTYALMGLIKFDDPTVDNILMQALRRDSYWRIRVAAAEGLGERNITEAVPLLEYKMKHDPEDQVKKAAVQALSELATSEAVTILNDFLLDDKKSQALRLEVLKVMLEKEIQGTADSLLAIMEEEWDKEDSQGKFMEYCCREASLVNWSALKPAFSRMLAHDNHYVQIYGIRGIRRISADDLYDDIAELDKEGVNGLVRREAAIEE